MKPPCARCHTNPPIVPRRAPTLCLRCWRVLVPVPTEYGALRSKHDVATTWASCLAIRGI